MANYGSELVRFVANSSVVANGDPSLFPNRFQPDVIRAVGREEFPMAPDVQSGDTQNIGKPRPEIAIGEEYERVTRLAQKAPLARSRS